ncbi:MAG: UDP-2,3-diacylglucosamine diphosphatase LpxI, partial [Proteobacteria bacterium]|nr:UDP-2,3-diacylglucosamine diphosphatase LpxI [Pseudomonadota bacterium]
MRLALFAGEGQLPKDIINQARLNRDELFVVAFNGLTPKEITAHTPHTWVSIGYVQDILDYLKENKITHIILAGSIQRPAFSEIKFDFKALLWLKKIGLKTAFGDDGLLAGILKLLEEEGYQIVSSLNYLKDLYVPEGLLTDQKPTGQDERDIERGIHILKALSAEDVGQAVIVQQGLVLGIEAIEGTQELIKRCASLKRKGEGGTLIKISKKGQDKRVDLPTIGFDTITQLYEAGLKG